MPSVFDVAEYILQEMAPHEPEEPDPEICTVHKVESLIL